MTFMFYHKRTFFIQPNLVQRLAHKMLDIPDVGDVHLPFPLMMLVLDDPISREAAHEHWPTNGPISIIAHKTVCVVDGETAGMEVIRVRLMIAPSNSEAASPVRS